MNNLPTLTILNCLITVQKLVLQRRIKVDIAVFHSLFLLDSRISIKSKFGVLATIEPSRFQIY